MIKGDTVTNERLEKSRIVLGQRSGRAGDLGFFDTEHCALDSLRERGLLGRPEDEQERYWAGYRLRELYYAFHKTGKALEDLGGAPGYSYESETETHADRAEDSYNKILRLTPQKYIDAIHTICIAHHEQQTLKDWLNRMNEKTLWMIQDSLDALHGSFFEFDRNRKV